MSDALSQRLDSLAARELAVPGRYHLNAVTPAPHRDPLWLQALRWLYERWLDIWNAFLSWMHVSNRAAAAIGDVLLVLLGIGLLALAVSLVRNLQRARSARVVAQPLAPPPDPAALYAQACEAAGRGDYNRAALALFAALLALLRGRDAVAYVPSMTVGDLRRRLHDGDRALLAPFDAVAVPFVQAAYAECAVGAPQWQRARDAFAALLQEPVRS